MKVNYLFQSCITSKRILSVVSPTVDCSDAAHYVLGNTGTETHGVLALIMLYEDFQIGSGKNLHGYSVSI